MKGLFQFSVLKSKGSNFSIDFMQGASCPVLEINTDLVRTIVFSHLSIARWENGADVTVSDSSPT